MKITIKYLVFIFLLSLSNCTNKKNKTGLAIALNTNSIAINDTLNLSIKNPKNHKIDTVEYLINDKVIASNEVLSKITLGKKKLTAKVTFNDKKTQIINKTIEVFNDTAPKIYTYKIINTYPHDINAYTQGLEFYNGELYESTGQRKQSKLRKINYETGEVLKNINLPDRYFGEGLTILNNKIYQLTWQAEVGFIYDLNSFKKLSTFKFNTSKEGWGICNDGKTLYKSDGTQRIWLINPETLTEISSIQVYTERGKIPRLNELEWVNGKIYANIYQKNGVVIINPINGGVEGVIDFSHLKNKVTQHDKLDVLNGIAYHPERQTIFVTGKNWNKLFEVKIIEQ